MSHTVTSERDGPVLVITICRPELRNAIDRATSEAIARAMTNSTATTLCVLAYSPAQARLFVRAWT